MVLLCQDKRTILLIEIFENADPNEVLSEQHYYPFGLAYNGPWIDNKAKQTRYLYNGKELNEDFGLDWHDYGARWYDASIGRWNAVDPLAEEYASISTYGYVANNPISLVDPDGMRIDVSQAQDYDEKNGTNYLQQIISDLTEQTGLSFSINDGFLEYNTDSEGNAIISTDADGNQIGSSIARGAIMKGIDHDDTGTFKLVESGGSQGDGLNFKVDVNQTQSFIDGTSLGLNNKTMGFGMMFTHELLHTDIGLGKPHEKEAYEWGRTGLIVNAMNAIRKQMGADYGERLSYLGFAYNGKTHLPFDSNNKTLIYHQLRTVQTRGSMYPKISPIRGKYLSY